jgi:hypothetical protein
VLLPTVHAYASCCEVTCGGFCIPSGPNCNNMCDPGLCCNLGYAECTWCCNAGSNCGCPITQC